MMPKKLPAEGGFEAVLFDLDGTLVDTAPDMVGVLFGLIERHRAASIDYEHARNNVSNGALGLLRIGFPDAGDEQLGRLHREYLADYSLRVCEASDVFSPLRDLLSACDTAGRKWGVVTNKPESLTLPLMEALGLGASAACIVSGDTLPQRKPHPAPILHAAELAGVSPERSLYVGDAARDIEAGSAAGMCTIAVGYGYIETDDDPLSWGADAFAADTMDLMQLVSLALDMEP